MIDIETIRIKSRRVYINKTAKIRKKKLDKTDFTIISNNCWGGFIYQSYDLKYNTPTVGLFFMADDYIEFISDIKNWIYKPIEFIEHTQSKYYKNFREWNKFGHYPIGKFKDSNIEIHFLHYKSKEEAVNNWQRRTERINWNKILYKFNDQNLCTREHIKRFCNLPYKNKLCFTAKEYNIENTIYIKSLFKYSEIKSSYEPFGNSKYINVTELLNNL